VLIRLGLALRARVPGGALPHPAALLDEAGGPLLAEDGAVLILE
jgi:hypothetical protein